MTLVSGAQGADGDTGSGAIRDIDILRLGSKKGRFQNHWPEPTWRWPQTQPGHSCLCQSFQVPGVATAPRKHKLLLCPLLSTRVSKDRVLEGWVWSVKGLHRASITFHFLNGSLFHPPLLRGQKIPRKERQGDADQPKSFAPCKEQGQCVLSEPRVPVWDHVQWDSCTGCGGEGQ